MMTRNCSAKLLSENMFHLVTAKFGLVVIVINCQLKAIEMTTNLWNVAVLQGDAHMQVTTTLLNENEQKVKIVPNHAH